jgi:hypothetical protein
MHDDATGFPNLALMKLSAAHKASGHDVEMFDPAQSFDVVYSSKVFSFTPTDDNLPAVTICGGTGYGLKGELPEDVEHACPDYSLYGIDYSVGFLTRGCNRNCTWCGVPDKEGLAHPHADVEEFLRHRDVVLLDNNVLQHPHGIAQIEKMARLGVRVDFNQGLDARLIDDGIARRLAALKWLKPIRLACDHAGMMPAIGKAVRWLRWHNATPRRYSCYCLVKDVDDAVERVRFLKGIDVDPFAQPYIAPDGSPPTKEQRRFARWVNHKAEFKSRTWDDYRAAHEGMAA